MKHQRYATKIAFAVGLIVFLRSANAQITVVSNLQNFPDSQSAVFYENFGSTSQGADVAQSFTAGNATPLSNVRLAFNYGDPADDSANFTASLYTDAAGSPGVFLATLTGDRSPDVLGEVHLHSPSEHDVDRVDYVLGSCGCALKYGTR